MGRPRDTGAPIPRPEAVTDAADDMRARWLLRAVLTPPIPEASVYLSGVADEAHKAAQRATGGTKRLAAVRDVLTAHPLGAGTVLDWADRIRRSSEAQWTRDYPERVRLLNGQSDALAAVQAIGPMGGE